jgi:LmbE family N-acetylglucosaminyl deacetylase
LALPTITSADILVVSPHPDDDVIIASGIVQRAVQRGEIVRIVFVTNGDAVGLSIAPTREAEAVTAQGILGVPENRVIFLGYPDGYTGTIRTTYTAPGSSLLTPNGASATYATRGLGLTDYHHFRFGSAGLYNWPTMVGDLTDIISSNRPTHIFTTSQWDTHPDHATAYHLVIAAAQNAVAANPGYNPTIHKTTVWPAGDPTWPGPSDPLAYHREIPRVAVSDPTEMIWTERESLDVPLSSQLPLSPINPKYMAICAHASQGGPDRYIGEWAHKDEFFWTEQVTGTNRPPVPDAGPEQIVDEGVTVTLDGTASWDRNGNPVTYQWRQVGGPAVTLSSATAARPTFVAPTGLAVDTYLAFELVVSDGSLSSVPDGLRVMVRSALRPPTFGLNVASQATFSASSARNGSEASKVADGVVDGYPNDETREWVTGGEGAGAWIQMNWSTAQTIAKVVLYDRPNSDDLMLAGTLVFGDGSTLAIGPLSNNATPVEYTFPARTVTSLRLNVTQVTATTRNVGLAEFQVFESGGVQHPPVANAGPDQTVSGSQTVTLNGSASSDPNNDPLTYHWTQTSGPAVTLSMTNPARPTFVAPPPLTGPQILRFSLFVSDGFTSSPPDTVDIVVSGTVNAPPVANAGLDVTAVPGASVSLNGSGSSDPEGLAITYQWTQTGGTAVVLSSATAASPAFAIPPSTPNGNLTFRLVVSDGVNTSAPDTVIVTVVGSMSGATNIAPTATVTASSERAPLQAAIKAVDGVVSGYPANSGAEWATSAQNAGSWIELRWPTSHNLIAIRLHDRPNTDDRVMSGTLTFSNGPSIAVGALNNDGTAVDVAFGARQVTWVRFTIDTVSAGTYSVGLAEVLAFEPNGTPPNQAPTAFAGPNQTVAGGSVVQLNGSGSDPEGATLTFAWTQTSGPPVTLTGANTATPGFTAPPAIRSTQTMRFQLVVNDGVQPSAPATTDVIVPALPNNAPVANAGPDQTVAGGTVVQLDGRGSTDLDADPLTFAWTQLAGPAVTITGAATAVPTFTAPAAQAHDAIFMFRLTVSDAFGGSSTDTVLVTVPAQPDPANIALLASATSSSETLPLQGAVKAIDGVVSGTPAMASAEWATVNERVGAWLQLDWPTDHTVNMVRLFDRINGTDQITGATLSFSDGSSVIIGALPNTTESALEVVFAPRTIRWLRLQTDAVSASTSAVGLAEIEVFEGTAPPATGIGINDVAVTEGNAGSVNAVFTVALSAASTQTITVNYATSNGTAASGQDYTAVSGTLTFAPGVVSQTITVPVLGDVLDEANETYGVDLSAAVNAAINDAQGLGTIVDNDASPSIAISNVTVTEGNAGTVNAAFNVTLSAASGQAATVDFGTANVTATAGQDYNALTGTVTFAPGVTSQPVTVQVIGDLTDEPTETFAVNLTNPVNATIADNQGVGTITDDDGAPTIAISDLTLTEGDAGNVTGTVTVSLSAASGQTVTVNYATANSTATTPADYLALSTTTLTFAPGVLSQTITVTAVGDALDEANETFFVNLTTPTNATIADAQGVVTITDDDASPSVAIGDVTVTETNAAGVTAVFTVTLSAASGQSLSVVYSTANSTATSPQDYTAAAATTLTFTAGQTSRTISVPIAGDLLDEADETFFVNLATPVNVTIADAQGVGTIVDNDPTPTLTVNDVTVNEGNTGSVNATVTVSLSAASGQTVSVGYTTANGTATAPQDYTAVPLTTLVFTPGQTTRTFTVPVIGDTLDEINENFVVDLTAPTNATIADAQGVVTITDNDATPNLRINDISVAEGNANATLTVTLSAASGLAVNVNWATANGTATVDQDYTSASGTLTFAPGTTTQTVVVPVLGDVLDEVNETVQVNLSVPVNATIADAQGILTITDDDPSPTIAINDVTITEGNSGSVNAVFTVTLSTVSGRAVTVTYVTANNTATAPQDYTALPSTVLTFPAGQTTQTITVSVAGDALDEANEQFFVNLSGAGGATIADNRGVGTITDDDPTPTLTINDMTVTETVGGTNAVFTVTLSAASGRAVTVNFATANGTALAGQDYTTTTGTLTFAAGVTTMTISVPILDDAAVEVNEGFVVNLTAPTNATLADNQGQGTIISNE